MSGGEEALGAPRQTALPDREFVTDVLASAFLDPQRRALYDLCFQHGDHLREAVTAEKLRRIVRLYAEYDGCSLSPEAVAQRLGRSGVDSWFGLLASAEALDPAQLLETHHRMMAVFADLSDVEARSLASKYLHFHFPELFYIYDTVVASVAARLVGDECASEGSPAPDPVYARHMACCRRLTQQLAPQLGRRLSPRELDPVLRAWSEREAVASGLLRPAALPTLRV